MSDCVEVMAIVEGKTEVIFINSLVQPYLAARNVFIHPTQVTKKGQKGGDVRFSRVKKDIAAHLKQRSDTLVTTFVDYYGVKEWPGLGDVPVGAEPGHIASVVNNAAKQAIVDEFSAWRAEQRFIPYMAIHEFEALLFSDSHALAKELEVTAEEIDAVIADCGQAEAVNRNKETAPSKRLDKWSASGKFPKTTAGIAVASAIGVEIMRTKCPVFDGWITALLDARAGG